MLMLLTQQLLLSSMVWYLKFALEKYKHSNFYFFFCRRVKLLTIQVLVFESKKNQSDTELLL